MRLDVALANLWVQPTKTAVSLAGVGVSIVLIFMQLGFRGAVENTATMIYDELQFDLLVRSPDYLHLADAATFERIWLQQLEGQPDVRRVTPLWIGMGSWRNPQGDSLQGVLLIGVQPTHRVFQDPQTQQAFQRLQTSADLLIDRETHADFGPRQGTRFSEADIGVQTEVNQVPVRVAGTFQMGAGLTANGAAIVPARGFEQLLPIPVDRRCSLGLVRLEPDRSPAKVRQELRRWLAQQSLGLPPVEILTRDEVSRNERRRWIGETPIGFIFSLGVGIAFLVGAAIVFSVMSNDVQRRLPEFATLKAMGYSNLAVCGIVVRQALYLGGLAFPPSLLVAWALYRLTAWLAQIPIEMRGERILWVFALTLAMAALSGLLALRRVWRADPASLF